MFQMTEVTSRTVGFRTSADGDRKALSVRRYEAKPPENLELVSHTHNQSILYDGDDNNNNNNRCRECIIFYIPITA